MTNTKSWEEEFEEKFGYFNIPVEVNDLVQSKDDPNVINIVKKDKSRPLIPDYITEYFRLEILGRNNDLLSFIKKVEDKAREEERGKWNLTPDRK